VEPRVPDIQLELPRLSVRASLRLATEAFEAVGIEHKDASIAAGVLVAADQRGIPSHGLARLRAYILAIQSGSVDPKARTRVLASRTSTEWWDAGHGLGHPVATRAMDRAISIASSHGVGVVVVRRSSHFGIAGAYVNQATAARVIGLAMTNADPHLLPTGAVRPGLGTNPIAVGASVSGRQGFLLDMATSVVPGGRLEVAEREGRAIPLGWAVDRGGFPTTDPTAGLQGALLPLGESGGAGHKGYGLAAAVDILTGVLGDSGWGLNVRSLYGNGRANVAHLLLAIDPAAFGGRTRFERRLSGWIRAMRGLGARGGDKVMIHGEPEAQAARQNLRTIPIHPSVAQDLAKLASELRLRSSPDMLRPRQSNQQPPSFKR
jgi:L-2-hydroxycarboxylate dehydrogenase (NAD+)